MPVLADITYLPSASFVMQRQYNPFFAVGWHDDTILITPGNPSEFQEIHFGGYRAVIRFKDWWWQWDNRSAQMNEVLEDLYALAPGSSTPSSLGAIQIRLQYEAQYLTWVYVIDLSPFAGCFYWWQRFPEQDRPYWTTIVDDVPPTPFAQNC